MNSYTKEEKQLFKKLSTPAKIQDFLDTLPFNFEEDCPTCFSPRQVLEKRMAHCVEGAIFAAAALEFHGARPLVLDLRSTSRPYDFDHVVAIYTRFGCFGAISKTNHAVLRYREPVYKTLRELIMSYFHEYFLSSTGKKTLREYSRPLDLRRFNPLDWRTSEKNLFDIPAYLDDVTHVPILSSSQIKNLRPADPVEILAGEIVEYKKRKF